MVRVVRPLRVIGRNAGLKLAVLSLLNSVGGIFHVFVISAMFFMLFGIFGINYFKGSFFHCHLANDFSPEGDLIMPKDLGIKTKWDCLNQGGDWLNEEANFDNIFKATLTLFEMSTTEGWVIIMMRGVDAVGPDFQPIQEYRRGWTYFFIAFILFGSLFIMNLFVGVVIDTFNKENDKLKKNELLTIQQREWV
jgi:voltage-dependent calcium channel T type alpha-1G